MAGEGAATGAVARAVGGMVSAMVFGGDPAEASMREALQTQLDIRAKYGVARACG